MGYAKSGGFKDINQSVSEDGEMTEKKDFMSTLAQEVEAKKHGQRSKIDSVDDFVSTRKLPKTDADADYDGEFEVEDGSQAAAPKAAAPAPQPVAKKASRRPEPEPEEEPEQPQEEVADDAGDEYETEGNPDSFSEEKLQKVDKPMLKIKPGVWIALACVVALIGGLVYWFQFAPHITVPDFTGKNISEVATWAKQNKIENSMIATTYEYNFDNAKDIVLSQSKSAGSKIKTDTPLTFTVSNGPDPDEAVAFPDNLKAMTQDEIQSWIDTNKLSKTKITTQYSTSVPSGGVISYDLKSVNENNFTRGTSLSIVCSKGPAPAGQITVDNFVGKTYAEIQTWASSKKITLVKNETYSDTVDSGYIISQSVASGSAMNEGDTLTVVVSKGKGVTIPNLVGYTKDELTAWQSDKNNTVVVVPHSVYNMALEGTVVGQSIDPGTKVDSGTVLTLEVSAYMPILETNSRAWLGKDYLELNKWCDDVNGKGANVLAIQKATTPTKTEYPTPGMITEYYCDGSLSSSSQADGCGRPLGLGARIYYTVTVATDSTPTPTPTPTATTSPTPTATTPVNHKLTINMVDAASGASLGSKTYEIPEGSYYLVAPTVPNFTATTDTIKGTITGDTDITINYNAN
jgi:beta-lactam-binding protein with PASTA domain